MSGVPGMRVVEVAGWPRPKGYVNGVVTSRPTLYVAGQVAWNERQEFEHHDMASQFGKALDNVLEVVRAAGGKPQGVVKMTIYVTDLAAYRAAASSIGPIWKARFGRHFPAMALVGVAGLVEPQALVEIEATAILETGHDGEPGRGSPNPSGHDGEPGSGSPNPSGHDGEPGSGSPNPSGHDGEPGSGSPNPSGHDGEPGRGSPNPSGHDGEPGRGSPNPSGSAT